ncbi:hypothetical protein [Spirosoma telluris]|uniref:hypothetical protein n=1 Tax=Spirosoma telluris TaxID=2183553 RepID=UPI0018DE4B89
MNLVDKKDRSEQSHSIVKGMRAGIQTIGQRYGANVKLVEVPPARRCCRRWWPKSMAPIMTSKCRWPAR